MANVNTIKTRILNKYDLFANYSNFTPLKGEVCVAVVGETTTTNQGLNGDITKKPVVGIKVGDGVNKFNDLPWIQAVAGDVSSFIKGITDEAKFNELVNAIIANAKLATTEQLQTISDLANSNKTNVEELQGIVKTGDNSNDNLRTAINNVLGTSSDGSSANTVHGAKKYAEEKAAAAQSAAEATAASKYEEKGVAANLVNALETGAVKTNTDAIGGINNKIGTTDIGSDITAAIKTLQDNIGASGENSLGTRVELLETAVGDASSGLVKDVADLKTADTNFTTRIDGIEDRVEANENKLAGIDTTVVAHVTSVKDELDGKITAITEDYLTSSDKQALQSQIDTIMNNPDTEGVINSINEFTQYIEDHGEIAEGFRTDINAIKTALNADENGAMESVDARIAAAITEADLGQYVTTDTFEAYQQQISDANYASKTEAEGYANTAKNEVIGESTDASTANTINAAKKYAEEKASAAQAAAAEDATSKANAAQTAAEAKVTALAGEGNTTTVKANADAIGALNASMKELVESDDKAGMVSNVTQNTETGKITVEHRAITNADLSTEDVFVFYCGNATGYAADMASVEI